MGPPFSKKCLSFMILHTLSPLTLLTLMMKYNKMKDETDIHNKMTNEIDINNYTQNESRIV